MRRCKIYCIYCGEMHETPQDVMACRLAKTAGMFTEGGVAWLEQGGSLKAILVSPENKALLRPDEVK